MILAGIRPPEYDAALRAKRARREAEAELRRTASTDREGDPRSRPDRAAEPERQGDRPSAVDIGPRPPAD